ncbi:hypothetical protein [Sphingomonas desiccabilis]|uniref:Uncharacterized protein n=1 Tax=Sphingomonas desiccabilis TaxID=429134 RepID=A0A4V1QPZ0_9SPHN|nr:hypothetical protein [Sphingomonas desiccabilis]MBB3910863.1 hypothetical protein [Sphingomonas desiccabilis]RXZ35467.1 hypothetical protein EO081_07570 [Sphingomonas desiccabilis]
MIDTEKLARKHGIPLGETVLQVPRELAEKPITRAEFVDCFQALQRFALSAAAVVAAAQKGDESTEAAADQLYAAMAANRKLLLKLIGQADG